MYKYIGFSMIGLLLILIAVVLIRTCICGLKRTKGIRGEKIEIDINKAIEDLSDMIKCKTVSYSIKRKEDEAEFYRFKEILKEKFPNVYAKCEYEEIEDRGILLRYKGECSEHPTVLMAHFDVVPVNEKKWKKPPFEGVFEDGVLWGRGALDTKVTVNAIMQAMEYYAKTSFVPQNDIYIAFAGDEEINGKTAPAIVEIFKARAITPGAVIDEGGAVLRDAFPGIKERCALIGVAEKGLLNAEISYSGNGGHSSTPKAHTPIGKLSAACIAIENHPFKYHICKPVKLMFKTLAAYASFGYRLLFSNIWLFSPILDKISKRSGGEINALVRTTCAFTQMQGAEGVNVIPSEAKMVANIRILPGESTESVIGKLRKKIKNPEIKVKNIGSMEPSEISDIDNNAWRVLSNTINETWEDTIVSPYLMFACSDSRHWGKISDRVYRFSPMELSNELRATIHGKDERITEDMIRKSVEFYIRLIQKI